MVRACCGRRPQARRALAFSLLGAARADGLAAAQIDMDTIETSNLNRQFLFRRHHVSMSKAQARRRACASGSSSAPLSASPRASAPAGGAPGRAALPAARAHRGAPRQREGGEVRRRLLFPLCAGAERPGQHGRAPPRQPPLPLRRRAAGGVRHRRLPRPGASQAPECAHLLSLPHSPRCRCHRSPCTSRAPRSASSASPSRRPRRSRCAPSATRPTSPSTASCGPRTCSSPRSSARRRPATWRRWRRRRRATTTRS